MNHLTILQKCTCMLKPMEDIKSILQKWRVCGGKVRNQKHLWRIRKCMNYFKCSNADAISFYYYIDWTHANETATTWRRSVWAGSVFGVHTMQYILFWRDYISCGKKPTLPTMQRKMNTCVNKPQNLSARSFSKNYSHSVCRDGELAVINVQFISGIFATVMWQAIHVIWGRSIFLFLNNVIPAIGIVDSLHSTVHTNTQCWIVATLLSFVQSKRCYCVLSGSYC